MVLRNSRRHNSTLGKKALLINTRPQAPGDYQGRFQDARTGRGSSH